MKTEHNALIVKLGARTLNANWLEAYTELAAVNAAIWRNEDELRRLRGNTTDWDKPQSLLVAFRSQELNDRRAELIEAINKDAGDHLGSEKL